MYSKIVLTSLEPQNSSLYQLQVRLFPKRVSSCEGVKDYLVPKVIVKVSPDRTKGLPKRVFIPLTLKGS